MLETGRYKYTEIQGRITATSSLEPAYRVKNECCLRSERY